MQVKSEVDLGFVDGDTIRKLGLTPVQVRKPKKLTLKQLAASTEEKWLVGMKGNDGG
jgi:hypothetical protein